LRNLYPVWNKWFGRELKFLSSNPWRFIERPRLDEPVPRYITPEERRHFLEWLSEYWDGWRLPILFFELANAVGRRLMQLTSLPSGCLKEGHRIEFVSVSCKGRKNEYDKLPKELFEELTALCGLNFLWEHFPAQLNAIYRRRRVGKRAEGFQ